MKIDDNVQDYSDRRLRCEIRKYAAMNSLDLLSEKGFKWLSALIAERDRRKAKTTPSELAVRIVNAMNDFAFDLHVEVPRIMRINEKGERMWRWCLYDGDKIASPLVGSAYTAEECAKGVGHYRISRQGDIELTPVLITKENQL